MPKHEGTKRTYHGKGNRAKMTKKKVPVVKGGDRVQSGANKLKKAAGKKSGYGKK